MGYQAFVRQKILKEGNDKRASPFLAAIAPYGFVEESQTLFTLSNPGVFPLAHTA
ncbi:MAG: hypothetical protein JRF50_03755 [Deltaproteobacteria bacterium]|nr:hypothetical protein [Deltaproteobacteria bacterium]